MSKSKPTSPDTEAFLKMAKARKKTRKEPPKASKTTEVTSSKDSFSWVELNTEKFPSVFFYGSLKEKSRIEQQVFETKQPYVLEEKNDEHGNRKKLSITPNATYGLMTSFDYDVCTAIWQYIYELKEEQGSCPELLEIAMPNFTRIMKKNKSGQLYNRIIDSIKRISSTEIFQENYVQVKNEEGDMELFTEVAINFFKFRKTQSKKVINKGTRGGSNTQTTIMIELPDWVVNNINRNYTTSIDTNTYFTLKEGRARMLFRRLEFIRYNRICTVNLTKLKKDLWIKDSEHKVENLALRRTFDALVQADYLKSYQLEPTANRVKIEFSEVKSTPQTPDLLSITSSIEEADDPLAQEIADKLGDKHSLAYFKKIVKEYPDDILYRCLSLTQEAIEMKRIKKSPAAFFTDLLKREGQKIPS